MVEIIKKIPLWIIVIIVLFVFTAINDLAFNNIKVVIGLWIGMPILTFILFLLEDFEIFDSSMLFKIIRNFIFSIALYCSFLLWGQNNWLRDRFGYQCLKGYHAEYSLGEVSRFFISWQDKLIFGLGSILFLLLLILIPVFVWHMSNIMLKKND